MFSMYQLYQQPQFIIGGLFILLVWTMIWKGIALWFSAKNQQKGWFVAIFLLNTLGLLPIIYLIWFKPANKEKVNEEVKAEVSSEKKTSKKRNNKKI